MFTVNGCPRCGGAFRVRLDDDLDGARVWCGECGFATCWPCAATTERDAAAWARVRTVDHRLQFLRGVLSERPQGP